MFLEFLEKTWVLPGHSCQLQALLTQEAGSTIRCHCHTRHHSHRSRHYQTRSQLCRVEWVWHSWLSSLVTRATAMEARARVRALVIIMYLKIWKWMMVCYYSCTTCHHDFTPTTAPPYFHLLHDDRRLVLRGRDRGSSNLGVVWSCQALDSGQGCPLQGFGIGRNL